jgi:hypothetical protein
MIWHTEACIAFHELSALVVASYDHEPSSDELAKLVAPGWTMVEVETTTIKGAATW